MRVNGIECHAECSGFRVQGFGIKVYGSGFRVYVLGLGVDSGFKVD